MHLTCTVSPRVFPTGCGEINELLGDDQQPDDPDLALLHQGGAHPSTRAVLDPRHEGELGRVVSFHRAGLALVPPRSNIAPTCARLVPLRRVRGRGHQRRRTRHLNADYEVRIVGTIKQTCRDIEENVHIAISLVLWLPFYGTVLHMSASRSMSASHRFHSSGTLRRSTKTGMASTSTTMKAPIPILDENDDGRASFAFVWPDRVETKNNGGRNAATAVAEKEKVSHVTQVARSHATKIAHGRFSARMRMTTTSYRYIRRS